MDSSNTSTYSLIVAQNLNSDMINGLSVSPLHKGVKWPEYCNEEKRSVEQTAEYFHCRVPSAQGPHPRQKLGWRVALSSFMPHSSLGTQMMMLQGLTLLLPCSSHHPPTVCWHPLSSTISLFPRGRGAFREEFHPRGTSIE